MKTINVVAAVIKQDNKILATQRGYGEFKGGWEFPGGKVEPNETHQQALIREIKEELNITIEVNNYIDTIEYDYPNFHLSMAVYFATIKQGTPTLLEHNASTWLTKETLDTVDWLKADITLIEKLKQLL